MSKYMIFNLRNFLPAMKPDLAVCSDARNLITTKVNKKEMRRRSSTRRKSDVSLDISLDANTVSSRKSPSRNRRETVDPEDLINILQTLDDSSSVGSNPYFGFGSVDQILKSASRPPDSSFIQNESSIMKSPKSNNKKSRSSTPLSDRKLRSTVDSNAFISLLDQVKTTDEMHAENNNSTYSTSQSEIISRTSLTVGSELETEQTYCMTELSVSRSSIGEMIDGGRRETINSIGLEAFAESNRRGTMTTADIDGFVQSNRRDTMDSIDLSNWQKELLAENESGISSSDLNASETKLPGAVRGRPSINASFISSISTEDEVHPSTAISQNQFSSATHASNKSEAIVTVDSSTLSMDESSLVDVIPSKTSGNRRETIDTVDLDSLMRFAEEDGNEERERATKKTRRNTGRESIETVALRASVDDLLRDVAEEDEISQDHQAFTKKSTRSRASSVSRGSSLSTVSAHELSLPADEDIDESFGNDTATVSDSVLMNMLDGDDLSVGNETAASLTSNLNLLTGPDSDDEGEDAEDQENTRPEADNQANSSMDTALLMGSIDAILDPHKADLQLSGGKPHITSTLINLNILILIACVYCV